MSRDTFDRFQEPDRGRFGDNDYQPSPRRGRVHGASDLVDLTVALHHETVKAVLVSADGTEARAAWLPKSVVEIERHHSQITGRRKNGQTVALAAITITLPERRAKEAGLL